MKYPATTQLFNHKAMKFEFRSQ